MKHILFYYLMRSRKFPSKRFMIAGVAVVSLLFLGAVAAIGHLVWTGGKSVIAKAHQYLPDQVPGNIDSTVQKMREMRVAESCKDTMGQFFVFEAWLSQPITAVFNKIVADCWPRRFEGLATEQL